MERKVALVTGSSSGLGAVTASSFAQRGYDVVIHCFMHQKEACALKESLEKQYAITALVVQGNISKEEEVKQMIKKIIGQFGKIDVLVNNAGIAKDELFFEKTVKDFKEVLDVNLIGTFLVSRTVAREMLLKKQGVIINIASTNGIDTYYPMSMDYDASKAGIISLTHNLSCELAPYIRVNAIAPGWMDTRMTENMNPLFRKEEESKILLKRFATPEEVAKVVTFIASEDASYINNTVIRVDGGISC